MYTYPIFDRFSHLISVDFFSDLLAILRKISASQSTAYREMNPDKARYSARSSLNCIIAAFKLLSGQGEALNIDLKDVSAALYQHLPDMLVPLQSTDSRKNVMVLLFTGLELMLLKRKQVRQRVTTFFCV